MYKYVNSINYKQISMFRAKDQKQQPLFNPRFHLSPKRRQILDWSWPGLFKEHILQELPVNELPPFLMPISEDRRKISIRSGRSYYSTGS